MDEYVSFDLSDPYLLYVNPSITTTWLHYGRQNGEAIKCGVCGEEFAITFAALNSNLMARRQAIDACEEHHKREHNE